MTKKILAIIPARGGSKGLPRKNILSLAGKPLIAWTIEASLNSKYNIHTVVSSDDDQILNISQEYGANTIKRPKCLATDSVSTEQVILHALKTLKKEYDYIILLQPTSPLRTTNDINNALEKFFQQKATALISVTKTNNKILKAFQQTKDDTIVPISNPNYPFMRRQDLPQTYMSNGAIYIIKVSEFLKNEILLTRKTIAFEMNKENSVDIDTLDDLNKAENMILE